jgi:hypothetical protein
MALIVPSYYVSGASPAVVAGAASGGGVYAIILPAFQSPNGEVTTVGVVSIGIVQNTAVQTSYVLGIGYTGITGAGDVFIPGTSERYALGSDANARIYTHWTDAGPTDSGSYYRRVTLPATIGASVEWTWPETAPFIIPATAVAGLTPGFGSVGLAIFNYGASNPGADIDLYVRWAEFSNITVPTDINALAPRTAFEIILLVPNHGPTAGGTFVTVTGKGLYNVVSLIGSTVGAVTFSLVSDTEITFTTPARGGPGVEVFAFSTLLQSAAKPFTYT